MSSTTLSPATHRTDLELTLDPPDWQAMRNLAHKALDEVLDYQMTIRDKPVWRQVPEATETFLSRPAPAQGLGDETVVNDMLAHVLPYPAGHAHPRFWGWVCGTGTPIGMVADMLAAGANASSGVFNDAASRVEAQVIGWMRDLFEFPGGASGIVTSGASVANIIGLAVGRDAVLGRDLPKAGLGSLPGQPTVYASQQVHSSVDKAVQLLGLGLNNLRKVPVDEQYRLRLDALADMVRTDREAGYLPCAVVASAGTVNTGAIDNLEAIAHFAREQKLWFHVDGAIGALAAMSPNIRPLFRGMALADSLAFDFHKWLYVPYEAGCVLIRDGQKHRHSFSVAASYLETPERGIGAMPDSTNARGPQLSRGFKALKVWAQIRDYGTETLGKLHDQNVAQAKYLADLVTASPDLELLAPVPLNIVCFRYAPTHLADAERSAVNREILMRLQEQGIAAPSSTKIDGHFAIRVAITNHRTRRHDLETLVQETQRLGRTIMP